MYQEKIDFEQALEKLRRVSLKYKTGYDPVL